MKPVPAAAVVDPHLFRKTCGRYATGVAVATVTDSEGKPYGLTVNSFTSVSCSPPLVLICVDYRCNLLPMFRSSSWYGINVLSDRQRELSVRFSQRELDRFDGIEWKPSEHGVPFIPSCLASLECCVSQTIESGDHAILIAEVTAAEWRDGEPLIYFGSSYRKLVP